ncbi:porin [Bartonella sp. HY328]
MCDILGKGYFYLPKTETFMRLTGLWLFGSFRR